MQAPPNIQSLADRVLVQRFSPVGILCNDKGDVLYISGRAGRYLEPAVGKANLNIFAMAREGLRYDLSKAFGRRCAKSTPSPRKASGSGRTGVRSPSTSWCRGSSSRGSSRHRHDRHHGRGERRSPPPEKKGKPHP